MIHRMYKTFVVSGYTGANYILRVRTLPQVGRTEIVQNKDNSVLYYGGNGLNVAVYLAKLGMTAIPVIRGGTDYEKQGYPKFLQQNNVSDKAVSTIKEDVTPVCYLIEDDNNDHMTFFYTGSMDAKYAPEEYPDGYFENVDWAVMTVASKPDNLAFLKAVKKHGIPMAFAMRPDPVAYPPSFLNMVLHEASLVFMNELEQSYIEETLGFEPTVELLNNGKAKAVIVTLGASGCVVYEMRDGKITAEPVSATRANAVVDTTGAGDSFLSAFLYGVVNGYDYKDCAKLGATFSSFIIEASGCLTNVPTESEMLERFKRRREKLL